MNQTIRLPNIRELVDPLLGTSYETFDCWQLVRNLLIQGFGLDIAEQPNQAALLMQEVWFRGDPREPLALTQPWDLYITCECEDRPWSTHVGLVIDDQAFVHARVATTGVAIERMRRWRPKLLQIARLRHVAGDA
jgi:hypothetical protein